MKNINIKHITGWMLIAVFAFISTDISAVPASPYPHTIIQEDGNELTVYLRGDEHFSYHLTEDGYLIQQGDDGMFRYAFQNEEGLIQATDIQVNNINNRLEKEEFFLEKQIAYPDFKETYRKRKQQRLAPMQSVKQSAFPNSGSPKSLVILVEYLDVEFVVPNPQEAFSRMLNEKGYSDNGATGSARDYFTDASFGISSPEFIVVGPYTLPNNRAYYGANDAWGEDKEPRQMVIDACYLAYADGVDFSEYDTNEDGIVDNVFVYYAGHNEAENGPRESIWPHRWHLETPLILNDVAIIGYACSSELRGAFGENMSGIGTFVHEFGHVYGLPDYYNTVNDSYHTLDAWSVMDGGTYLNQGRTPPTYSAYDRFYLGWLKPKILSYPQNVFLEDLETSNWAYIMTLDKEHNLDGYNPNPNEFILLENRQKTGWDKYLPGHGMLATRVVYNHEDWKNNVVNNNHHALGYEIIEADGIASSGTLSSDPFPGSKGVTAFYPTLRDGTDMGQPITNIQEIGEIVYFSYMGGGNDLSRFSDKKSKLKVIIDHENKNFYIDSEDKTKSNIYIYNFEGKLYKTIRKDERQPYSLQGLPTREWLIIKVGNQATKLKL